MILLHRCDELLAAHGVVVACIIASCSAAREQDETRHFPVTSQPRSHDHRFSIFLLQNNPTMEGENVASSTTAPVETAEGDGGATKCSVCKKRLGRKSECFNVSSCFSRLHILCVLSKSFLVKKIYHLIAVLDVLGY